MKTFRIIGMALFAVLMCVNLASCSSSGDDPTEEPEEGGVVVSGKRITKIVGMSKNSDSEIYTFKYDNKGRLIETTKLCKENEYEETYTYNFTWGDNAIKTSDDSGYKYTFILKNGLVQGISKNYTFTYSKSNRIIQIDQWGEYETILWDGNKLVSITDEDEWDATLTYEKSCKKGYFPFIATMIDVMYEDLFIANPEIAGMLTTQLPASMAKTYVPKISTATPRKYTFNFTYEFDKEGYISKIIKKGSDGSLWTYTLTWK